MEYRPFRVVRLRDGRNRGRDAFGDLFCVRAKGNFELVRTGETPEYALINGTCSRSSAQELCDALNAAFAAHYNGVQP